MNHWLLDNLKDLRQEALSQAGRAQIHGELLGKPFEEDEDLIRRASGALEIAVLDLLTEDIKNDEERQKELKRIAADAFRLLRSLPMPNDAMGAGEQMLNACALAVLGDKGSDAARWLQKDGWPDLPLESDDWGVRTWATILDTWLRLIRKSGWEDRDAVLRCIAELRDSQSLFEKTYLKAKAPDHAKALALELIGLYHLAKAGEILAYYMTDGVVDGKYQIHQLLETHFDRAKAVCDTAYMIKLEPLSRLLAACAAQMADNSIWTVTRAVNTRVTKFVKTLVDRGRGDRAIFEVLPPQRRTLAEKGLLGSSRRAVVVSLPTSSGKTLIAEFRILQALNQFEHERGWVAYLVPTRTLVNQITRRLRRDFEPLGIAVERISPALEVDTIEDDLLSQRDQEKEFRVLVTTPEKLDLVIRQGWENKIDRPLTLVVVDEAHNIQDEERGLKLELLLATINNECQKAQFLLLTPFISNAKEVAQWLGRQNSEDVSLALDWQPNDRIVGVVRPSRGEAIRKGSYDYRIHLDAVHTSRETLFVDKPLNLQKNHDIAKTFSKITDGIALAAVTAQSLQERGPIIVMHTRPSWVWSLAERFKIRSNRIDISKNIELVQRFVEMEFGPSFPLVDLMSYGVGVHHAGLSEDVRLLMEWLFEANELRFLVATTTVAQGVNFPVSGVVMASHQYPYGKDMPPEDFWNIAGRAGRIEQGSLGVVALVASGLANVDKLKGFINRQSGELNSSLIQLALNAKKFMNDLGNLREIVFKDPCWSSFVQYLAHTYRQMGKPESFAEDAEQVLRGTFGFEKLKSRDAAMANRLLDGVHAYARFLQEPGQPLGLVDSTGFSLQSIRKVLSDAGKAGIRGETWNAESLFSRGNQDLQDMMGILLRVPELRQNLNEVTGGSSKDGCKLALIIKDWVHGMPLRDIAEDYFMNKRKNPTAAMTACGQNLFGKLTQTAAWGLGALLSITGAGLDEEKFRSLRNLPSRVFYGVNDDAAISLRLLGVPRTAATRLAGSMGDVLGRPLTDVRTHLREMDKSNWRRALGRREGDVYRKVWRVLEGLD